MRQRHPYQAYRYPFLESTKGRIDEGQDFTGKGPILAIGKAKILSIKPQPGWPEGGGLLYELLEGPKAGSKIFVYEGVNVARYLRAGMIVRPGQPIATFRPGGSIEIGFANAQGAPLAQPTYKEGQVTTYGKEMQRFLGHLNAGPPPSAYKAPSFWEQAEWQAQHPGQTAKEDAGAVAGVAGGLAGEIISGILGDIHPEALMLNIGLVGGGAFLVYYGAALMLGVKRPVAGPAEAGAKIAVTKGAVK